MYEPEDMDLKARLDEREQTAKENLRAWLEWFMVAYASRAPNRARLAKVLGVSGGAVTQILDRTANRGVHMRTLIAIKLALGGSYSIDTILFEKPPDLPTTPPVTAPRKR